MFSNYNELRLAIVSLASWLCSDCTINEYYTYRQWTIAELLSSIPAALSLFVGLTCRCQWCVFYFTTSATANVPTCAIRSIPKIGSRGHC